MFAFRWIVMAVALIGAAVSGAPSPAGAVEGQPRVFGRLDLADKLLSPQQFGPASAFAPAVLGEQIVPEPPSRVVEKPAEPPAARAVEAARPRPNVAAKRPHRPAPSRNARRAPSNPLDSYARDTRGQAWPCKGDGICAWK